MIIYVRAEYCALFVSRHKKFDSVLVLLVVRTRSMVKYDEVTLILWIEIMIFKFL